MTESTVGRRALLRAAVVSGGVLSVGGCSDDDAATSASGESPTSEAPTTATSPRTKGGPDEKPGDSAGGLGPVSAIEVGGGVIYPEQEVVVTQPTKGELKAFTTICTHQGCPVSSIKAGEIECPCHFSRYSIADGSVVSGPAPAPLAEKPVTVRDGRVILG